MAHPAQNPNDLLTVKQAAAYVPCSESTIKRRIYSEELPSLKFGKNGRKHFIKPEDLDKVFVPSGCGTPEPTEDERIEASARAIAAEAPELTAERKAHLRGLHS